MRLKSFICLTYLPVKFLRNDLAPLDIPQIEEAQVAKASKGVFPPPFLISFKELARSYKINR
jgi:hypothetical protein